MEKITLIDTSVGSTNRGDEIIMNCAEEELEWLLQKYYPLYIPSHLRGFGMDECIGNLPDSASEVAASKYKFVCGTNLLAQNMLHRSNQWNINLLNSKPLVGSVLVGVGGKGKVLNSYTRKLYKKVLSNYYIHSVRNKAAYECLTDLGLKCLNTGCVTLWKLTPDFCQTIPIQKSKRVIFTLTDYNKDPENDYSMVKTLLRNYEDVSFWIQGVHDLDYLKSLIEIKNIHIIPSSLKAYDRVLSSRIDYVGTRLHAGIFAMRHGVRSIIIKIDERMNSMECCIPNNCLSRNSVSELDVRINTPFHTKTFLDWNAISQWKGQFR